MAPGGPGLDRVRSGDGPGDSCPGAVLEALNLGGVIWFGGNKDEYVVVLSTPGEVEAVRPDLERIRRLPVSRVLVTAPGGDDADFTSRNFAPVLGLDEDQATGSAHAVRRSRHHHHPRGVAPQNRRRATGSDKS
jgi:predicted PhzF superfamily epimerase YddE/YHI9